MLIPFTFLFVVPCRLWYCTVPRLPLPKPTPLISVTSLLPKVSLLLRNSVPLLLTLPTATLVFLERRNTGASSWRHRSSHNHIHLQPHHHHTLLHEFIQPQYTERLFLVRISVRRECILTIYEITKTTFKLVCQSLSHSTLCRTDQKLTSQGK